MEKLKHFKSNEKLIYEMKDIPFITSCISTTFSYTAAGVYDVNISKILDGLPQVRIEDSRLLETRRCFELFQRRQLCNQNNEQKTLDVITLI